MREFRQRKYKRREPSTKLGTYTLGPSKRDEANRGYLEGIGNEVRIKPREWNSWKPRQECASRMKEWPYVQKTDEKVRREKSTGFDNNMKVTGDFNWVNVRIENRNWNRMQGGENPE